MPAPSARRTKIVGIDKFAARPQKKKKPDGNRSGLNLRTESTGGLLANRQQAREPVSVLRHAGIDPVRPGQYPSREIVDLFESGLSQEVNGFRATHA